jgi:acyl transferase domain-containing protein
VTEAADGPQLLVLSAKSAEALDAATARLATHLREHPETNLADTAFTLQTGRRTFSHRRVVAAGSAEEAAIALEQRSAKRVATRHERSPSPEVVFMFPGQGAQYAGMGTQLAASEPLFRAAMDRCAEILRPELGGDFREALNDPQRVVQTEITQPALVAVEYALAQVWLGRGIKPSAMIGHSVGEFVAAVLAGVMTLEHALHLVAGRAKIVQALPAGAMLAVRLPESEVAGLLGDELAVAAANSPRLCVLSGTFAAIEAAEQKLNAQGVAQRRLSTSHAFHSAMMEPALAPFTDLLRSVPLQEPRIPYVSNVTGQWITAAEATDPHYWAAHVRQTVRFSAGVTELLKDPNRVLLEVGPGNTLVQLARQHGSVTALATMQEGDEAYSPWLALGQLWLAGVPIDWHALHEGKTPRRVSLPGYPFERQRYWIEPKRPTKNATCSPVNGSSESAGAGIESLVLQQLEMMSRQLETLQPTPGETAHRP